MSPGPALVAALLAAAPAPPPALEALAVQLRAQVLAAHPEPPVGVVAQAPSAALGETAATLLATRLSEAGLPSVVIGAGEDAVSRARAAGARSLVRLRVEVGMDVAAAGELRPVWRNFWAGRTPVETGPAAVLSATAAVDRATQLLAAGSSQGTGLVLDAAPLARFPARTAALATGDLDGDGHPEVAVLAGGEVWVLDGTGTLLARHALLDLPPAAAPAREPFGTLCISEGRLLVAWARAEAPVALRLQGAQLVRGPGAPGPSLGCGEAAEAATFVPGAARFQLTRGPEREPLWGGDARPGHRLLLLPDGTARWVQPGSEVRLLRDVGAAAALVPWRGEMRVAASSAAAAPAEDRLRLLGTGPEEPTVAVPGRILQVCAGAPGPGPALLLGVWTADGGSELRVVRGAP
ncbi:MAG TPA: FG-GAP repeat protein [Myxococcaceae bacterium]